MTIALFLVLVIMGAAVFGYAAGARAGYYRGVAWGQHLAGREMMHILSHGEECSHPLPKASLEDLRPPRRNWEPN